MSDTVEVIINWKGPFLSKEIKDKNEGLYQFYGFHPVYGGYVLLYISGGENIADEIKRHRRDGYLSRRVPECQRSNPMNIYIGSAQGSTDVSLEEIEKLLIFSHCPVWNSEGIDEYKSDCSFNIFNRGTRVALLEEVKQADYKLYKDDQRKLSKAKKSVLQGYAPYQDTEIVLNEIISYIGQRKQPVSTTEIAEHLFSGKDRYNNRTHTLLMKLFHMRKVRYAHWEGHGAEYGSPWILTKK